jgi:hypothetical protein
MGIISEAGAKAEGKRGHLVNARGCQGNPFYRLKIVHPLELER